MEWVRFTIAVVIALAFLYFLMVVVGNIARGTEFSEWQWIQQVTPPSKNL